MQLVQIRPAHHLLLVLTSGGLLLGTFGPSHANEDNALGGFFQQLFSAPSSPAPQPSPPPAVQDPTPRAGYGYAPRRAWRQFGRHHLSREVPEKAARVRPKIRYVALPKPGKVRATVAEKPKVADSKAVMLAKAGDPGSALLHDATLRKGDIVIMADGPKVFTGKTGEQHRAGEFEDASRSSALDRRTRQLLAAMVRPVGAMPAEEARKYLAKLRSHPVPTNSGAQASASPVRVVYSPGQPEVNTPSKS
ncbi:hypothetical protein [Methylobacterium frigidaeris]|uniref:Uncharacterized protein n=1 Tax=Methylobacterium frigidaeris TaxID=2038277 RepID=A0AA37HHJ9_9HYPH|nr:hypothetical protein [Methylobacterium frigidaeris]GJD65912.1 hypothetical protein MPEAHAMD_6108 [Methylobacterium frigidaeris]